MILSFKKMIKIGLFASVMKFCTPHFYILYIYIGIMVRVFANGLGDRGSIPGRVIPKTKKMVLDAA